MRGFVCVLLTGALFCSSARGIEVPATSAASVVLMDADSGRVLYERGGDDRRLIASITKLMTALVALESGHALDEVVTIRPEWTGIEGSSLYLKPGEEITLEALLYGLLLRSGNDAAHAVAGYCGGDQESFVARMNAKANELGMENTSFSNPSGLNAENHYSSARDMAVLARACLNNEMLRTIVSTRSITIGGRIITNHNKLLWQYEGCIGLKTGYTEKAGRTLVSAAERDGMTLICVTLNAPNDWRDHTALFDYGFSQYERRRLVKAGEMLCQIPVTGSLAPVCRIRAQEDVWAALADGETPDLRLDLEQESLAAPAEQGDRMGVAVISLAGEELVRLPILVPCTIPSNTVPERTGIARFFGR